MTTAIGPDGAEAALRLDLFIKRRGCVRSGRQSFESRRKFVWRSRTERISCPTGLSTQERIAVRQSSALRMYPAQMLP